MTHIYKVYTAILLELALLISGRSFRTDIGTSLAGELANLVNGL